MPVEVPIDLLAGNCYLYVQSLTGWLPRTSQIVPNTIYPVVGGVIVLWYGNTPHYVYVAGVLEEGVRVKHSNFGKPGYYENLFSWNYLEEHKASYLRSN